MKFADVCETGWLVNKDTGIAVPDGFMADKQNIIQMIDRVKMIAGDADAAVNAVAIAFAVGGNIHFFKGTGIIDHAVLHISGGNKNRYVIVDIFFLLQSAGKFQFKIHNGIDQAKLGSGVPQEYPLFSYAVV